MTRLLGKNWIVVTSLKCPLRVLCMVPSATDPTDTSDPFPEANNLPLGEISMQDTALSLTGQKSVFGLYTVIFLISSSGHST